MNEKHRGTKCLSEALEATGVCRKLMDLMALETPSKLRQKCILLALSLRCTPKSVFTLIITLIINFIFAVYYVS